MHGWVGRPGVEVEAGLGVGLCAAPCGSWQRAVGNCPTPAASGMPPLTHRAPTPIPQHLPQEIEQRGVQPVLYPYGSRGPVGAHYLAAKHGVRWGDLAADDE